MSSSASTSAIRNPVDLTDHARQDTSMNDTDLPRDVSFCGPETLLNGSPSAARIVPAGTRIAETFCLHSCNPKSIDKSA